MFENVKEAKEWLKFQVKESVYKEGMELSGHHAGENKCLRGCSERELDTIYISAILRKEK